MPHTPSLFHIVETNVDSFCCACFLLQCLDAHAFWEHQICSMDSFMLMCMLTVMVQSRSLLSYRPEHLFCGIDTHSGDAFIILDSLSLAAVLDPSVVETAACH